jgi:hypothetical protein
MAIRITLLLAIIIGIILIAIVANYIGYLLIYFMALIALILAYANNTKLLYNEATLIPGLIIATILIIILAN